MKSKIPELLFFQFNFTNFFNYSTVEVDSNTNIVYFFLCGTTYKFKNTISEKNVIFKVSKWLQTDMIVYKKENFESGSQSTKDENFKRATSKTPKH